MTEVDITYEVNFGGEQGFILPTPTEKVVTTKIFYPGDDNAYVLTLRSDGAWPPALLEYKGKEVWRAEGLPPQDLVNYKITEIIKSEAFAKGYMEGQRSIARSFQAVLDKALGKILNT